MMKKIIDKRMKPRVLIRFNTGSRVHKPKKGKGSYCRKFEIDA